MKQTPDSIVCNVLRILISEKIAEDINRLIFQLTEKNISIEAVKLQEMLSDPNIKIIVAIHENLTIVGMATLVRVPKVTGTHCELHDVVVLEPWRGLGIASAMVMFAIHNQPRYFADAMYFELTSNSGRGAAIALYKSLGFEMRETNVMRLAIP